MPHLPQIFPMCKNKDNLYFIKAFTGVSNLTAKLTFVRFLPKWAKAIEDNNNNNNISKAPFPNGPKALFTRLKIQIYNKTLKKLKDN